MEEREREMIRKSGKGRRIERREQKANKMSRGSGMLEKRFPCVFFTSSLDSRCFSLPSRKSGSLSFTRRAYTCRGIASSPHREPFSPSLSIISLVRNITSPLLHFSPSLPCIPHPPSTAVQDHFRISIQTDKELLSSPCPASLSFHPFSPPLRSFAFCLSQRVMFYVREELILE